MEGDAWMVMVHQQQFYDLILFRILSLHSRGEDLWSGRGGIRRKEVGIHRKPPITTAYQTWLSISQLLIRIDKTNEQTDRE